MKKIVRRYHLAEGAAFKVYGWYCKNTKGDTEFRTIDNTTIPTKYIKEWRELSDKQKAAYIEHKYQRELENIDLEIAKDETLSDLRPQWRKSSLVEYNQHLEDLSEWLDCDDEHPENWKHVGPGYILESN